MNICTCKYCTNKWQTHTLHGNLVAQRSGGFAVLLLLLQCNLLLGGGVTAVRLQLQLVSVVS